MKNPLRKIQHIADWLNDREASHDVRKLREQYSPMVEEAEKKKEWNERDRLLSEWGFETDLVLDPVYARKAEKLTAKARKYGITVPRQPATAGEENKDWVFSVDGFWLLRKETEQRLHREIREEFRKGATLGFALLGFVLGLASILVAVLQWTTNKKAADAAKQAADVAEKTLQSAKNATWLDQRAWVTLVAAQTPELHANEPITVSLRIENSGKTPAEKLNWHFTLEIFKRGEEGKFRSGRQVIGEEMRMGPLNPNSHRSIPPIPAINQQSGKVETFTPQIAKALADGSIFIMGYGKLTYVDAWKVEHWVRFCDIPFGKPSEGFSPCAEYNDIDHNEPKQ